MVAGLVAVLLVPAAGAPAEAKPAPEPPAVPSFGAVAKIFPALRGGEVEIKSEGAVRYAGRGCADGAKVDGAVGRLATYTPSPPPRWSPVELPQPDFSVDLAAERLPSARVARTYFRRAATQAGRCFRQLGSVRRVPVRLGDQSVGYRITVPFTDDITLHADAVLVRRGDQAFFVSASAVSDPMPGFRRTVRLARLALRTAR